MLRALFTLFCLLALGAAPVRGQAGTLDLTFGTDGKVTTDFDGQSDLAYALTIQPDGKLVAAGYALVGTTRDFTLARYLPDGSPDLGFGTDGKVVTDFAAGNDFGYAILGLSDLVVADGRIVVAGHARVGAGEPDFALARYLADGTLDLSFGTDGLVMTDFGGRDDYGYALAVQPDGKLLVGGDARTASGAYEFGLARYLPNGAPDPSFGTDGKVMTDFAGGYDGVGSLVVQPGGRIVAAGRVAIPGRGNDFGLARYLPDGTLDASFGTNGKVSVDFFGGDDRASEVIRQPDGKLLVVGRAHNGTHFVFALARFEADGTPDATFGAGGKLTTDFGGQDSRAATVLVQPDGRIVVAGVSGGDFALARYSSSGTLDATFATGGVQTTDFSGGTDAATSMIRQPDGKLVLAGYASVPGTGNDFALARYENGSGGPAACDMSSTAPSYPGGYVLNHDEDRAFVRVLAPTGGVSFEFYSLNNLVIGEPQAGVEGHAALPGYSRVGDTFTFAPGSEPTEVFFPIWHANPARASVAFFLDVTDTCNRSVDVDPAFSLLADDAGTLDGFALAPAQPSPVASQATIRFSLAAAARVRLVVYDVLGREVMRLVDDVRPAGEQSVRLDAAGLPSGLYVYRLEADGRALTRTLTVTR